MTPQAEPQPLDAVTVLLNAARGRIEKDAPGRPALP